MSSFANLFSSANFVSTVQKYCKSIGWNISEIDSRKAILKFSASSGRVQTVYIIRYDSTLEFSVPSMAAFDSEDSVPHFISTLLLKRNSSRKFGFWSIEEIGGKHVFSAMHNAELELMDAPYFQKIVTALVSDCDEFETMLINLLRNM